MRFPDRFLDDIRDRLPISEVIGKRVQFDKKKTNAAKGDFWGCCPFHGEKTPSFHCEDRKGRYYCFGCGVSGDHFRFITELEGLSFAEAVEQLAQQAGLPMPVMNKAEQRREEQRKTLFDVMELAAGFYRDQLQSANGAAARSYLRDRGMSAAIQQEFGVGFAPNDRNALKEYLASKGVDAKQMEGCGLVVHGEGIAVSYDRFRNRIMFPIEDSKGRTIAFGGRAMDSDAKAKYLNSPETELFHKSNVLYNFARARTSVHKSSEVIVAEGYMDVIALHAAGFTNAVAPLGTALTESHLQTLWRICEKPTLCFDGDEAGKRAASKTIDLALPSLAETKTVKFLQLPDKMDPDDFLKQYGPEKFREIFNAATPMHEMLWERRNTKVVLQTPEQKAKFEKDIMHDISLIRDPSVAKYYKSHYKLRLAELFGQSKWGRAANDNQKNDFAKDTIKKLKEAKSWIRILLGLCVEYPGVVREFVEEIIVLDLGDEEFNKFFSKLYMLYVEYEDLSVAKIYEKLGKEFYLTLASVHGYEEVFHTELSTGELIKHYRQRGHKLRQLFPVIKFEPPISTIRDVVRFIISQIYHKLALVELENLTKASASDADQIYNLSISIRKQKDELDYLESQLDEQFQSMKGRSIAVLDLAA